MMLIVGEALMDLIGATRSEFQAVPGGAPANVALALSRQGVHAALLARISDDAFGRQLREHLLAGGVDLALAARASEPTTIALAALGSDGSASYTFYTDGTADWQWHDEELPGDELVPEAAHFGSLALALPPGAAMLESLMARYAVNGRTTVSYDPNIRPGIGASRESEVRRVERQSALARIVKASDEDLEWLYPGEDAADSARRLLSNPGQIALVTLGAEGALLLRDGHPAHHEPARRTEVVDTVGGGDAFIAGFLAHLRRLGAISATAAFDARATSAETLHEALRWGSVVGSLTCERAGAHSPTHDEVLAALG